MTFKLSDAQRATLRPGTSAQAVEELLNRVRVDSRERVLSYYQVGSGAYALRFEDPQMQVLHERASGAGAVAPAERVPSVRRATTPIRVVIAPSLPEEDAGAIIMRSSSPDRPDLVVIPEAHASAFQLYVALRALWSNRQEHPGAGAPARIVVRIAPNFSGPESDRIVARAEAEFGRMLRELRNQAPQWVEGFGNVRAAELRSE
ncbi:MAG TPA: hypothetical protein VFH27_02280 [Longimicrobiaceae bacterium]|nr:hypothetical protein [Longimicrobiaceae bacterium]